MNPAKAIQSIGHPMLNDEHKAVRKQGSRLRILHVIDLKCTDQNKYHVWGPQYFDLKQQRYVDIDQLPLPHYRLLRCGDVAKIDVLRTLPAGPNEAPVVYLVHD